MKINLTILNDFLPRINRISSDIKSPYTFTFDHIRFPDDSEYDSEALYIIDLSHSAHSYFSFPRTASVVFIGLPAETDFFHFEWISVHSETDVFALVNDINSVFSTFNQWEEKMWNMLTEKSTLHNFGIPFAELVGNPTGFYTNYLKTIYNITDPSKPLPWHYSYDVGTYPSEEEMEILYNDEEYRASFKTTEPTIFSSTIYGYRMLYLNLFEYGECIGRFTVDEIYKKLRPSDASILLLYSDFFLKAYRQTPSEEIELSVRVNRLLDAYLRGEKNLPDENSILNSLNWQKDHKYVCLCIKPTEACPLTLSEIAMVIYHFLDDDYAYQLSDQVLFIMNLQRIDNRSEIFRALENHCRRNNMVTGISGSFTGLENLPTFLSQAQTALSYACKGTDKPLVHFEDIVSNCFREANLAYHDYSFYITEKVRKIIDYDHKHHADLLKTLRTALQNNMSATVSLEKLHIHRTTYLYRIRRLQEISGMDLSDYSTRFYLSVLFTLLPEEYF